MDAEILAALNDIKIAIYWLIAIVVIGVIANWIRAGVSVKSLIKNNIDESFSQEASDLYAKGKLDELLEHCKEKLEYMPNHAYALWYKAKAHYKMQKYEEAKQSFKLLAESEPSWDETHVQPYLSKIDAKESENR